jgi:hypothetical protein
MLEVIAGLLIGFILGTYAGHKFSLSRDKRKEHNDAIRPLKDTVLKLIDGLGKGAYGYVKEQDIDNIRTYIPEKKFNEIKKAYGNYCDFYSEKVRSLPRDQNGLRGSLNDDALNRLIELAGKIVRLLKLK